jgi:hypothetical protein
MSGIVNVFPLLVLIAVFAFMFGKSNEKRVINQEDVIFTFKKKLQSIFPELGFSLHKSEFYDCNNIAIVKTSVGRPVVVVGTASYIKGMKSDPIQQVLLREYSIQFDEQWLETICEFIENNFDRAKINDDL